MKLTQVQGVFDWLSKSNCLFFAWGGSVRDAVTGILSLYYIYNAVILCSPPTDIDGAVTCNPHHLKRICVAKYGRYEIFFFQMIALRV